jgi:hypothetical protein
MLSTDLAALATTMARYSVQGGRFIDPAACRALHHVLADLTDQARALERQVLPPAARFTPASAEAGGNVIPLNTATARRTPAPWHPDGGTAA